MESVKIKEGAYAKLLLLIFLWGILTELYIEKMHFVQECAERYLLYKQETDELCIDWVKEYEKLQIDDFL